MADFEEEILDHLDHDTTPNVDLSLMDEIESKMRKRHDLIHEYVCNKLGLEFGEKMIGSIFDYKDNDFNLISKQTPDILINNEEEIKIIDITVSSSSYSSQNKLKKYDFARRTLKRLTGKPVTVDYIRIDPITLELDQSTKYIENILPIQEEFDILNKKLMILLQTSEGMKWHLDNSQFNNLKKSMTFEQFKVLEMYRSSANKPFKDESDLMDVLSSNLEIPSEDSFIDHCLECFDPKSSKLTKDSKPNIKSFWEYHKNMSCNMIHDPEYSSNNLKFRSYLPLPNIEGIKMNMTQSRFTTDDDTEILSVLSLLSRSSDEYCRIISERSKPVTSDQSYKYKILNNFQCYRRCNFSREERMRISMDGPGRKHFSKFSEEHRKRALKNSNYWINPEVDVEEITHLSLRYSKVENPQDHPKDWRGPGLDYLRMCQMIYRELNINSLRRCINKFHMLKPTGIKGLYLIIHSGPMLRQGEQGTIIWFKLVAVPLEENHNLKFFEHNSHWKSWTSRDNVWVSRWLSTDSNRLDHYLRCYDRVLMAYLSYITINESNYVVSVQGDESNMLGLMIMIYLEDKRSTSKMLQDMRYIFMNKLSIFDYGSEVLKRFQVPIRTPLQLYLLKKITSYLTLDYRSIVSKLIFGKAREMNTSIKLNDKFSGAIVKLKRIVSTGPDINFDQILHEIYLCMLFNKNQDSATHASFQILTKMLEGEASLTEIKNTTNLHIGHNSEWRKDIEELIKNDHRNQFSRLAIILGSRLQSISRFNSTFQGESAHMISSKSHRINKSLDEFATFKSSSMLDRKYYEEIHPSQKDKKLSKLVDDSELYFDGHDVKENDEGYILGKNSTKQNRRRRCAQGVISLMSENLFCSFDVVDKYYSQEECFQVFKKNQIGGVREILILSIQDRVKINVLETFSREICVKDSREMLTHGNVKNHKYQEMMRRVRLKNVNGKVFNLNFDKSKWGPSFQPIQFLYIFYPYKDSFPDLFNFICCLLINHTNKKIILPERLIRAWIRDPSNKMKHHMDDNLQRLKEKFLKDGCLLADNESNMGQGILHFTSSLLHLCLVSFRDKLFERLMMRKSYSGIFWEDILSSDDSYTCLNTGTNDSAVSKNILKDFLHCQEISERLFNCETSRSKSSISPIVSEFNSLFGVNLSLHPTRIKFALSTMDVFYTDSFLRMVKESYNVCRAFFENGAQLDLFKISHELNQIFCHHVYATDSDNDPKKILNIARCPYQLGIYPIGHPILMIIFGPEFHNLEILSNWESLSDKEKLVFQNSHNCTDLKDITMMTEFMNKTDIMGGVRNIVAKIRPSRLISSLRKLSPYDKHEIFEKIKIDPLIIIRSANTNDEVKLKVSMKLFQNSSAEAARNVNPAFFYGRMSASRTSNCFAIQGVEKKLMTYREALNEMITLDSIIDSRIIYTNLEKYKSAKTLIKESTPDFVARNLLEVKKHHTLVLQETDHMFMHPLHEILHHIWIKKNYKSSYERDSRTLMEIYPFLKDSEVGGIKETIRCLDVNPDRGLQLLILLLMRIIGENYRPMKLVNYGDSSRDVKGTIFNLHMNNIVEHSVGVYDLSESFSTSGFSNFELIRLVCNMCCISISNGEKTLSRIVEIIPFRNYVNFLNHPIVTVIQKKLAFMMLCKSSYAEDMIFLTDKTNFIVSKYEKEQIKVGDDYVGNGIVKLQIGSYIMKFDMENQNVVVNKIDAVKTSLMLKEAYRMLGLNEKKYSQKDANYKMIEWSLVKGDNGNLRLVIDEKLNKISFLPGDISIRNNQIILFDRENGKMLIKVKNYFQFTSCRDYHDSFPRLYKGVLVKNLIKLGFFSPDFHLENLKRSTCLDSIEELEIEKPKMSKFALLNLGIEKKEDVESHNVKEILDVEAEEDVLSFDFLDQLMEEKKTQIKIDPDPPDQVGSYDLELVDETVLETWDLGLSSVFNKEEIVYKKTKTASEILNNRIHHCAENLVVHSLFHVERLNVMHFDDLNEKFKTSPYLKSLRNCFLYVYNENFGGLLNILDLETLDEDTEIINFISIKALKKFQVKQRSKIDYNDL